ncbi:HAD superfamily hydrolase [Sclerotinia borealis F-4128]|uniref:HAD superfamily hydrolase n=1 Tax=Sclerotinia borealis (strain F-4128) TaxID=1432307 RepID=W9C768_SCLBF|nr:HAD superfamily hydrolase [Sclerotinia borealis F-4128]
MVPRTDFPPIRACLFDMDGLLLDSEDKYTLVTNTLLKKYNKPSIPWSIKAQMQGRPAASATAIFFSWANLPISNEQYIEEQESLKKELFQTCMPLPGVEILLRELENARTRGKEERKLHIALATSSHREMYDVKTTNHVTLFETFPTHRKVLGDDPRIGPGRGKPAPDIYLLALETINLSLEKGEEPVKPEECLVFEDSVPGVESGRRAGMRVIWCPHPELKGEFIGREGEVLAGSTGEGGVLKEDGVVGTVGDGWADYLETLESFPYERYGILVN